MKRFAFALAVAGSLLASAASADQLIQTPTADIVSGVKGEYMHRFEGREDEGYGTLLFRAGLAYELAFRYNNNLDRDHSVEAGGQFQLLPDGVITPGIAVGMWDVTNSSPWGRRAFFVITKGLRPGTSPVPLPRFIDQLQLNVGAGTGRFSGIFASAKVDLPARFSLVGEFDARRFNAGLWYTPIQQVTLKAELQNGNPYFGGNFNLRF